MIGSVGAVVVGEREGETGKIEVILGNLQILLLGVISDLVSKVPGIRILNIFQKQGQF